MLLQRFVSNALLIYAVVVVARKAVRATVVLLPLLGIIYVILIVNPSDHRISKHVFTYFNSVLQSSQVCTSNTRLSIASLTFLKQ